MNLFNFPVVNYLNTTMKIKKVVHFLIFLWAKLNFVFRKQWLALKRAVV